MSWLFSLVPSWLEGIFHIVSRIGKVLWGVIVANFALLVFIMGLLYFVWQLLLPLIENVGVHAVAILEMVGGSITAMQAMVDAGWPEEIARGIHFANQHVPLAELILMIVSLSFLWMVCTVLRIIKSFVPTVS
jgi:hypothetical protein